MSQEIKYQIEILENRKVAGSLHLIRLQKPQDFSYIPGQYIYINLADHEGKGSFFALSCHPDEKELELLIKDQGHIAADLSRSGPGVKVDISEPIGPGFAPEKLHGKTLYMITHGSGLSAIKPVIEEIRKNRNQYGPSRLLYGVKTVSDFPFKDTLRDWMGSIEVYDIISTPTTDKNIWNGEIGYVQDILKKISPSPKEAIALVVGSKQMFTEVSEILRGFGFTDEQILTNL